MYEFDDTGPPNTQQEVVDMHRTLLETNRILVRVEKLLGWIFGAAVFFVAWVLFK